MMATQANSSDTEELPVPVDDFDDFGLTEIGRLASWELSSYKPGCGVDELKHESTELFWQSDGPQPHFLKLHFTRQMHVVAIRVYIDSSLDESYTPTRIGIEAGYGSSNIIEFTQMVLKDPMGWQSVDFSTVGAPAPYRDRDGQVKEENVLHTFKINFLIKENLQNGKDTHLRAVKVYVRHMDRDKAYDGDVSLPPPKVAVEQGRTRSNKKKTPAEMMADLDGDDLGEFSSMDYKMKEDIR